MAATLLIVAWGTVVRAQPATPAAEAAPDDKPSATAPAESAESAAGAQEPDQDRKSAARNHYEKGLRLYRESAWAAALAELLESRRLYPTWSATSSAAVCLQKLQRFDEALDLFEILLREFSAVMPQAAAEAARRAVVDLRGLVGTVDIEGAELGAAIVIDGQSRGDYPPLALLRVAAGSHVVRVYKEGFEPFEKRVDIAGGQTVRVAAHLRTLAHSGRLRVAEQQGKVLDVIVDGNTVGRTPWEGPVAVGDHMVVLRGEGNLGTQPVSAPVRFQQLTPLSLVAEELDASIRVAPTPAGATVAIDSVIVGRGIWQGRLRAGAHKIEVAAEGFIATGREVRLTRDAHEVFTVALQRDLSSPLWRKPGRFVVDLAGAVAVTPGFGGELAGSCGGTCSSSPGIGGVGIFHGGYELGSGFGFGLTAGYLTASQTITDRSTSIRAEGRLCNGTPCPGIAGDILRLQGFMAGAWAELSFGERFPIHIRLGGGALLGSMSDTRTGTFEASNPELPAYRVGPVSTVPPAHFIYVDPEVRAGIALASRFELSIGLDLMMLINLSRPRWDPDLAVDASDDGIGKFEGETLAGALLVVIAPSLGARYAF
jgi:hypothetical protein